MKKSGLWICSCVILLCLSACGGGNAGNEGAGAASPGQKAETGGDANGDPSSSPAKGSAGDEGTKDGKATIVFSTFWPDERFQEAKKKYEALHPNIEIKLEDSPTNDANVEADIKKYTTTTNTAMLAGSGADLLEMDLLPTDSYVRNRLLVDLDTMIAQDPAFRKEDYFANILDNAKIGGGLYGMPLSFFLYGLAGDEDALAKAGVQIDDKAWSWSDFTETAKQLAKQGGPSHVIGANPNELLAQMVTDNYALYIDEAKRKASFDSASFTGLMRQVKSMADEGIISADRVNPTFRPIQINSPWDYLVSLREFAEHAELYFKPHAQDAAAGGYFRTYRTIGLNAKSQVKQQAWDFIKFMMSEQIETPPEKAGFPINKNAFAKQLQQLRAEKTVRTYKEGPLHGMTIDVDEAKLDLLQNFLAGAVHSVEFKPTQVTQIVLEESKAYFSGQKSAEDVAKLIQNKATTYLNE